MKLRHLLPFAATLILTGPSLAAPAALVDAVQVPAWRVRGDNTEALAPGMDIQNGDQVRTGPGARAYLKLAEGSTVKLGESAEMNFHSRSLKPQSFFRGALDILTGAFRFTTAQAAKLRKRDVAIRVGTATIGIRGTDVWGKSSGEQDLVMLIEGHGLGNMDHLVLLRAVATQALKMGHQVGLQAGLAGIVLGGGIEGDPAGPAPHHRVGVASPIDVQPFLDDRIDGFQELVGVGRAGIGRPGMESRRELGFEPVTRTGEVIDLDWLESAGHGPSDTPRNTHLVSTRAHPRKVSL